MAHQTGVTGAAAPPGYHTSGNSPAIQDSQGGDIATLLLERLDAYKHATGNLEDYVEATAKQYGGWAKDYEKVLKTVSNPLREGEHFSQNNGGISTFFENIRSNTTAMANSQIETEKAIKSIVLPQLSRLHTEIKNKHKELSSGAGKGTKTVDKSRAATQKEIEHLGQHTAAFESFGGKNEPNNDPYIIQRHVYHNLHAQLMEENHHRRDLVEVQNNFVTFEKHILATIQTAMNSFYQHVGGQLDKTKSLYGDIAMTVGNIPPEFEWTNFTSRNGHVLVNPNTPDRTIDSVNFPNQDHASTKPMVEGMLQRKGKIMRSYNASHYAVTPAGFLHEFHETNDFRAKPESEMSLHLPDCVIGPPPGPGEAKFNIAGKDAGKSLTAKHEYAFKANTHEEAMKWYSVIQQFTSGGMSRQNSLLQSPVSPVGPAGEKNVAPLNTNVTNAPMMGSPATATPHSATVAPHNAAGETAVLHGKS